MDYTEYEDTPSLFLVGVDGRGEVRWFESGAIGIGRLGFSMVEVGRGGGERMVDVKRDMR